MTLFSKKDKYILANNWFRESAKDVRNPGRGWYRIYTYTLGENETGDLPPTLYEGESLALVLINIGAYKDGPITKEGLSSIERILSAFAGSGVDMLLRIVYDTQGKGIENEPASFSQVIAHVEQIGEVLLKYAEYICVFQGLFVGSWGEMHTSKFLSDKFLRQITEALLESTEGRIKIAFRTPTHLRRIAVSGDELYEKIGFFDDAMLADETHLGTFSTLPQEEVGWVNPWCIKEEMAFIEKASHCVPFGGEVLSGTNALTSEEIIKQLGLLHVSYLNCMHDAACLESWKALPTEQGVSVYDYVGAHLGYRFVVESAELVKKGKEYSLDISIANKGFACCPKELELLLYIQSYASLAAWIKPEELLPGTSRTWKIPLKNEWLVAGHMFSAGLQSKEDGRDYRFANDGAKQQLRLGTLRYEGEK